MILLWLSFPIPYTTRIEHSLMAICILSIFSPYFWHFLPEGNWKYIPLCAVEPTEPPEESSHYARVQLWVLQLQDQQHGTTHAAQAAHSFVNGCSVFRQALHLRQMPVHVQQQDGVGEACEEHSRGINRATVWALWLHNVVCKGNEEPLFVPAQARQQPYPMWSVSFHHNASGRSKAACGGQTSGHQVPVQWMQLFHWR